MITLTKADFSKRHVAVAEFDWVSDGSGNASLTTDQKFTGLIVGVANIPSTVAPPTSGYNVLVQDEYGTDLLLTAGLGVAVPGGSADTVGAVFSPFFPITNSPLTIDVSGAGAATEGKIVLLFKDAELTNT